MDGPIVGGALWRALIRRANYRCQCRGACGLKHTNGQGRCVAENHELGPLVAVTVEDLSLAATLRAGLEDLEAVCAICYDGIHAGRRRAARIAAAAALAEAQGTLC